MHYLRLPLSALALLLLAACNDNAPRDIRDYFFPLRELTDGLVYEYRDVRHDSLTPDFWYYRTLPTDTAYYFTKAYYQNDFVPRNLYRERMVNNGILLEDLYLYETDSTGLQTPAKATVLSANVFPFEVGAVPDEVFIYQVRFQLPSQPHGTTTLLINRRFAGDTTYVFEDKTYPAIRFDIKGTVDQRDSIIGDIEPRFTGQEVYAKDLGLVLYARDYGAAGGGFRHQLVRRYPMQELERKAETKLEVGSTKSEGGN